MKSLSESKPPNYLLLPLAIIHSEIFWVYSAVYCLLLEPVTRKQSSTLKTPLCQELRHRSLSDPQMKTNNKGQLTEKEKKRALRRESLPESSLYHNNMIRHRPTVLDELKGTTCPPAWWQKTRLRFGHPPVNTIDKGIEEESIIPISRSSSNNTFVNTKRTLSPATSSIFTPTHSSKSSFSSSSSKRFLSAHNESEMTTPPLSPQLSTQSTNSSVPSSKPEKKFKKMLKKLNTALHHIPHAHRKNSSSD